VARIDIDLYEVLGVSRDASAAEIKHAYRRLVRECHPDYHPDDREKEEQFKRVAVAYEILSDPEKRRQYDIYGTVRPAGAPVDVFGDFATISDLFDFFFGETMGVGRRQARRRPMDPAYSEGEDLRERIELTLAETLSEQTRTLKVRRLESCPACAGSRLQPGTEPTVCERCHGSGMVTVTRQSLLGVFSSTSTCPACKGRGARIEHPCRECGGTGLRPKDRTVEVTVPAGITDGMTLRLQGEGHAGTGGGRSGDLLLRIEVKPHPVFVVDGTNLLAELPVSYAELLLGAEIPVEHVDGERLTAMVAAKTQPGSLLTLRGKGLPHLNSRGAGDLLLLVALDFPEHLSREEKELLRGLGGGRRKSKTGGRTETDASPRQLRKLRELS